MKKIRIGNALIGEKEPCFIIAEAGVNHNGDIKLAKRLIDSAKEAGADAVKFQTFKAEDVAAESAKTAIYQKKSTKEVKSQLKMLKNLELSQESHEQLMKYAKQKKIIFLSTPFDKQSVDLLVELGVPLIKIGSGEITNHPFLEYIAKKDLPIILSTGMSDLEEVAEATSIIKETGCGDLILLHCTSNYPARIEDCNLKAMNTISDEFNVPIGYSDHTLGIFIPLAAVAMGACVIEKHFTLDKNLMGPDHKTSLAPDEFEKMVCGVRVIETAMGSPLKSAVEAELEMQESSRRSIVAKMDIPNGIVITEDMLGFKRPGIGIAPKDIKKILNKEAKVNIKKDDLITMEMLSEHDE